MTATFRRVSENLSGYDAMHGGFREAEVSGNEANAVTVPMQLSNLLAIDYHSRSPTVPAFFGSSQSRRYATGSDQMVT